MFCFFVNKLFYWYFYYAAKLHIFLQTENKKGKIFAIILKASTFYFQENICKYQYFGVSLQIKRKQKLGNNGIQLQRD